MILQLQMLKYSCLRSLIQESSHPPYGCREIGRCRWFLESEALGVALSGSVPVALDKIWLRRAVGLFSVMKSCVDVPIHEQGSHCNRKAPQALRTFLIR
jgi:hypothetical protein